MISLVYSFILSAYSGTSRELRAVILSRSKYNPREKSLQRRRKNRRQTLKELNIFL